MKIFLFMIVIIISFKSIKAEEGGYTDRLSYTQGDSISFYISTKRALYNLSIFNLVDTVNSVIEYNNIQGGERITPDSSYLKGCNWSLTKRMSSAILDPGVYEAQFPTSRGIFKIVFFIKSKAPGSLSKILVVPSTNTWQAYNPFGGKSLYNFNSTNGVRSYKVSFLRPSTQIIGYPEFVRNEELIIKWLMQNNIDVEYAVDYDLHKNPALLSKYKIVIIAGHSEYWSYEQRYQLQKFLNQGGKIVILSGNTCWFQVRFENDGKTMVCYKENSLDPLYGIADSLVTNNWALPPINNPENTLIGVGFLAGGYVNNNNRLPSSLGYGDYAAYNTWHWVYEGTGLKDGDEYGYNESIVGNEVDGALFNWQNGIPIVSGQDGSPKNFLILGLSPAESDYTFTNKPHATMGIYHNISGGTVFNCATINWGNGLKQNTEVDQITKNVLNKFLRNTFPPVIKSWSPFNITYRQVNNEDIPLNNRNFFSESAHVYNLKVSAEDKPGNLIRYAWEVNGVKHSSDSLFNFNFAGINASSKVTYVKCKVFNNTDTTGISWNFFNKELAFYDPPELKVGFLNVKIPVFNASNLPLQFTYNGPSGLTIDNNGVLNGTLSSIENINITLIVQNGQHSDTLVYSTLVSTNENFSSFPEKYSLLQNYPNPFNPATTIKYSLLERSYVTIKVFNVLGREIKSMVNMSQSSGFYSVVFDGSDLASGVYFYHLSAGKYSETRKFVIQK